MRVFLDHAATSPLIEPARKAAERWLNCGNASALYQEGRLAKAAIDEAREIVSNRLGVEFAEVIFTSSATESAVLAIVGSALAAPPGVRYKIVFSAAEHHCVLNTAETVQRLGFEVVLAPVDRYGRVQVDILKSILEKCDVLLVSAMHANNEVGSLNDVASIGTMCRETGTLFFCDAVQSFCKLGFIAGDLGADMISTSGHKIGGPKGVGALYIRGGVKLKPILAGGGQERGVRGGTENVAAIAGFGAAVKAAESRVHSPLLRDLLARQLELLGAVRTVCEEIPQLPTHLHVRFPGISAETLLILLDRLKLSVGSGAACSSGSIEPSHVLLAAGYSELEAKEGVRITFSPDSLAGHVKFARDQIATALDQIRQKQQLGT